MIFNIFVILEMVFEYTQDKYPYQPPTVDAPSEQGGQNVGEPARKLYKGRYSSQIRSSHRTTDSTIHGQIERYFSWNHDDFDGELDSIKFWTNDKVRSAMPNLARLAIRVLSVPASSASVERVFSHGSIILRPHRSSLTDTHLSELIILKCNRLHLE